MRITKYEHSCFVIEEAGKVLVVDPGVFTRTLPELSNVCAIIVTHVHPDHFDINQLQTIQAKNPDAMIYTVGEVAKELGTQKHEVVQAGTSKHCGDFRVSFYGGKHAIISESLPVMENVGILVNQKFYYPGDSLVAPDNVPIHTLAIPAVAPWSKISETMDFVAAVKPKHAFPVHNAILSDIGNSIYNPRLQAALEETAGSFTYLEPGQSLSV